MNFHQELKSNLNSRLSGVQDEQLGSRMHFKQVCRPMASSLFYSVATYSEMKDTPSTSKVVRKKNTKEHSSTDPDEPVICTKGGVKAPFPVKLMDILNHIDTKEPSLASVISWQPSGESFKVRDKKRFEKEVQSRYFRTHTSYTSFRRQLNLWGFKRIGNKYSDDHGAYFHEMFKRNDLYACRLMRRRKNNSSNANSRIQASSIQSKSKTSKKQTATKARRISTGPNDNDGFSPLVTSDTPMKTDKTFRKVDFMDKHDSNKEIHLTNLSSRPYLATSQVLDFEPIVDVKECTLPYKAMVLFLANAIQDSDYFQT